MGQVSEWGVLLVAAGGVLGRVLRRRMNALWTPEVATEGALGPVSQSEANPLLGDDADDEEALEGEEKGAWGRAGRAGDDWQWYCVMPLGDSPSGSSI